MTERRSAAAAIVVTEQGVLNWRGKSYSCALGRSGLTSDKAEGDGATPRGRFTLRRAFHRPDRCARPRTALPVEALGRHDGWCDASGDPKYNRRVRLPYPASCEALWRDDGLYDLIVVIGHNDNPVCAGAGSAIFLHVAAPGLAPTEGCIAVPLPDLIEILANCGPSTQIIID